MGALIWLASYPKSGNTWVRSFLLNLLSDKDEPLDINLMSGFSPTDSARAWYEPFASAPLGELAPPEIAKLRPQGHRRITELRPDPILVKTHNFLGNWHGVPLHTRAVTAGAIYIVRNPLDVASSVRHHFDMRDMDGAIEFLGSEGSGTKLSKEHVPEFYRSWSGHVRSWTESSNPRIHIVKYEDLIASPDIHFAGLVKFLRIPASHTQIARAVRFSSFDQMKQQEAGGGFNERPERSEVFFREGRSGGWRDALTRTHAERIVADHREQMARFNYVPDGF